MKPKIKINQTFYKLIGVVAIFSLHSICIGSDINVAKSKLEQSIDELATLRSLISEERAPLAGELRKLENEVIELRRERERMQRLVDNQSTDKASLENQVKAYSDESTYVINLLSDYYNRLNSSLSVAEVSRYQPDLLEVLNGADATGLAQSERLKIQVSSLANPIERAEELVGGLRFDGEAVLPSGELAQGEFAVMGPVTYFAANDKSSAGIVLRGSSDTPALIEFDPKQTPAIGAFIASGSGSLPIDPTLGRALAIATADESLVEHFMKGGLWMYPIAFFAIFATLIAILKLIQIFTTKDMPEAKLEEIFSLLKEGNMTEANNLAKSLPGPGARLVSLGLRNVNYSKDLMEEFLFEVVLEEKPRLERGIAFVMLSASVAPLLGLLGTVTGMIETFKLLTLFGTGDAKSLSSGISQALITTEFGLVAAIPSLILAALIGRLAAAKLGNLENLLLKFSNGIAALKEEKVPVSA